MGMKFVIFILMLTVVLVQARLNFWKDLMFSQKAIINYLFPKDPGIVRVRKPEEVKTAVNNVTTMDFIGLVERYGYSAEEHYVTTEDGYILTIHRISASPLCKGRQKRGVIFFQNGLLSSSDLWVLTGPGKDLAFLLADEGYDIWLGNYRGNTYCRSHIKLSSRDRDFWQYSYHEIGTRDLPAMIDYVLSNTKQKFLRYSNRELGNLSDRSAYRYTVLSRLNATRFLSAETCYCLLFISYYIHFYYNLCVYIFDIYDYICSLTALPEILSYFPAGTSIPLLIHYYQNFVTKKFQTFDYGYFGNYKQYGQMTPIMYDLNKVTAPLALFYGANDVLAPVANVWETYKRLPNVILLEEIAYKLFSHTDFLFAIDVKTLIYDRVIELFQKIDNN
ncbi:LIP3 Lipase, partial [Acromyrmex heyeri]